MKGSFFVFVIILSSLCATGQIARSEALFKTLKTADSLLFNVGFNHCDLAQFEQLLSDDFEFYHDEAGVTRSKKTFIDNVRNGVCKLLYKPRRVLNENDLNVYPLKKNGVIYGAVQTGTHVFYALEQGKPEYVTSIASFTHVWLLENGQWRLTRGLSYNHHMPDSAGDVNDSLVFADRVETDRWLAKKQIPALGIGYIEDGKVKQVTVYGKGIDGSPHPDNMLFNVASLTKPVTAMVALHLVNEGKWTLDEPISKYWTDPDVAGDARSKKLTIRHILSHRSGFANWRRTNDGKKLVFEFEPGTKYQYSGEGFEYLRKAIENVTGKTLDKVADELIFRPLGMKDTRFYWDKTVDEARFARWHKADGTLYATYKNTTANGADDLLTTVADYSKFVVYVMNGAGLKKELYEQMTGEQVRIAPRKYFGLGWWVDEDVRPGEDALVHGGDDKGVHTMAFVLPKTKQGLVIFTNCDNGTDAYVAVLQHYLGKQGQEIIDIETK